LCYYVFYYEGFSAPNVVQNLKLLFGLQAPEGETQPSTEVDLFISTEKIMVLNTDLKVSVTAAV